MERIPEKPSESDCCGSGCNPCVFDIYETLVKKYEKGEVISHTSNTKIRHDLLSAIKYKPFKVLNIEKINESHRVYTFRPVMSDETIAARKRNPSLPFVTSDQLTDTIIEGVLPYHPGQYFIMINVKSSLEQAFSSNLTPSISRSYTPVSVACNENNCEVKIVIKLYEKGIMSSFMRELQLHDIVYFRGAFGDFEHKRNSKYLMFCSGTGLAPMYSIVKAVLMDEEDETVLRLCFACGTIDDILFREEIRQFAKYWNFTATVYLSKEAPENLRLLCRYGENIHLQKIDLSAVQEQVKPDFKVLICGSEKFNEDVCGYAKQSGCEDIFLF